MTSTSSAITSQIGSMAAVILLIQLSRRIDITNTRNVLLIRLAYGVSQILSLLFLALLRQRILGKKEKGVVEVEEPPKPFSAPDQAPKRERISVCEYDIREVNKQMQQTVISLLIMCVLHGWFNFVQPLILQAILPWKTLLTLPVVRIHLWGSEATGDLARPWKAPNPFGDLMGAVEEAKNPAIPPSTVTRVDDDDYEDGESEDESGKEEKPKAKAKLVNGKKEETKPKRAGGRKED